MNAAASDGDDRRMSRPTAMRFAFRYATKAAPMARAPVLVDLIGICSADVVSLEDVGVEEHVCLKPAVIGDDRLVAEHDAVLDDGAAPDVAMAAEDRAADNGVLAERQLAQTIARSTEACSSIWHCRPTTE